jgi:hypothetical protein
MTGAQGSARLISKLWHGLRHDRCSCTRKALPATTVDRMLGETIGAMRLTPAAQAPAPNSTSGLRGVAALSGHGCRTLYGCRGPSRCWTQPDGKLIERERGPDG